MLSVNIAYESMNSNATFTFANYDIEEATKQLSVIINAKSNLKIVHHNKEKYWFISFPAELSFQEFETIHEFILNLKSICYNAKVQDSRAFIGYLKDGSEAYIYHRFDEWKEFILSAKHRSMEGQKVEVFDGETQLGAGILLDYQVKENNTFQIISATLLTKYGEQIFSSNQLSITPTGEFF